MAAISSLFHGSCGGSDSQKKELTPSQKAFQASRATVQKLTEENALLFERFKTFKHIPEIVQVVFLLASAVFAFSPFFWPSMSMWIPIVALVGGEIVISFVVVRPIEKMAREVKEIESHLKFHKTFQWAIENNSSPYIVSEADVAPKDSRLKSDQIDAHDDLGQKVNKSGKKEDADSINRRHGFFSTKDVRVVCDKYGLEPGIGVHRMTASRCGQSTFEANRDLPRQLGDIRRVLELERMQLALQPPDKFSIYGRKYLTNLACQLGQLWGLPENAVQRGKRYQKFVKTNLADIRKQYEKRFVQCKSLYEKVLDSSEKLKLLNLKLIIFKRWKNFRREKGVLTEPPTMEQLTSEQLMWKMGQTWIYWEYWDARLTLLQKEFTNLDWDMQSMVLQKELSVLKETVSLDALRENIARTREGIYSQYGSYPDGPSIEECNQFEKRLTVLEKSYYGSCFRNLSEQEKIHEISELQRKLRDLFNDFKSNVKCVKLAQEASQLWDDYEKFFSQEEGIFADKLAGLLVFQDRFRTLLVTSSAAKLCDKEKAKIECLEEEYKTALINLTNVSSEEKIQKLKNLKNKFIKILIHLNEIGAKVKLQDVQAMTMRQIIHLKNRANRFPGVRFRNEQVLRNGLIQVDQRIMSQSYVTAYSTVLRSIVALGLIVFTFHYSDNPWVFSGCALGSIQLYLLQMWFKKNYVVKLVKKKQNLKLAYHLLQNPSSMQKKYLPPVSKEAMKFSRTLAIPSQQALLLSRAIMT